MLGSPIDFVGSDSKHRDAVERIAGTHKNTADPEANEWRDPTNRRGSLLVYVAADPANAAGRVSVEDLDEKPAAEDLAVLMSLAAPARATPHGKSVIEWTVRRPALTGTAAVDK